MKGEVQVDIFISKLVPLGLNRHGETLTAVAYFLTAGKRSGTTSFSWLFAVERWASDQSVFVLADVWGL